ncbi:MAG: M13 family peptidase, partial [Bacteroidetes bacterium]
MKIRNIIISALALTVISCGQTADKNTKTDNMSTSVGIDLTNMDSSVMPGENFFQYANGGWLKKNPIPEEYSRYGAFEVLAKKNEKEIKGLIEELAAMDKVEKGTPSQQIRDYYNAGMDTNTIEELGMKPIEPIIAEINSINKKDDLISMQAKLNMMGSYPLFAVFSSQDDKNSTEVIA